MKVKDIIKYTEWIPNPRYEAVSPKFSIFMPTFRRAASGHLERAIQSVLRQTFQEFELIIIDDASTDGSFDIIKKYMQMDPRVHCLHHPRNVGLPALSCYEAYKVSRGEYLMFCFDDNEYQFDVLQKISEYLKLNPFKIGFGYIRRILGDGFGFYHFLGRDKISQRHLKIKNFLPNMAAVLHRSLPEEIGFLDPHLGIARVSDWDYWKRAAEVYEIRHIPIYFGVEYGETTDNSLGQTYPLNTSLVYEWFDIKRNDSLQPGNYEEYDVQSIPEELSWQSRASLLDLSQFYSQKFWYNSSQSLSMSIEHGKVLVVSSDLSASISLSFENLSKSFFYFSTFDSINFATVIHMQAVIIVRDLLNTACTNLIQFLKELDIPVYYYLDDNFFVLRKYLRELDSYTPDYIKKQLKNFSAVLVSTPSLQKYFIDNGIHDNVYVYPPILPNREWFDYPTIPPKPLGTFRFGFLGGYHRYQNFVDYIQPALEQLAAEQSIEVVVVGDLPVSSQHFTVYRYPIDYSYKLTLGRLLSSDIDVLIHPASFTPNNPYKTLNVLINAWAIGAVPVLANQSPYQDVELLEIGYLCEPENVSSWHEKLKMAIADTKRSQQIRENLHAFLMSHYSGKQNEDVINKLLAQLPAVGFETIRKRYHKLVTSYDLTNAWQMNSIESISGFTLLKVLLRRVKRKLLRLM